MRSYFLVLLSILVITSCGKSGGGSGSSNSNKQEEQTCFDSTDCEVNAPGGIDLLESMIDVSVTVTSNEILFRESKSSKVRGRAIECETSVKGGDIYRYNLNGDELELFMGARKYTMARLNQSSGIKGAWAWRGYEANRVYVIRSVTFIDNTRMIIKTHCEN